MKLHDKQHNGAKSIKIVPEFNVASASFLALESKNLKEPDMRWLARHDQLHFHSIEKPIPFLKRSYLSDWKNLLWLIKYEQNPIGKVHAQVSLGIFTKVNLMLDLMIPQESHVNQPEFREFIRTFISAVMLGCNAEIIELFFKNPSDYAFLTDLGFEMQYPIWVIKPAPELCANPIIPLTGYELSADRWWKYNDKSKDSESLNYILGKRKVLEESCKPKPPRRKPRSLIKRLFLWS